MFAGDLKRIRYVGSRDEYRRTFSSLLAWLIYERSCKQGNDFFGYSTTVPLFNEALIISLFTESSAFTWNSSRMACASLDSGGKVKAGAVAWGMAAIRAVVPEHPSPRRFPPL